MKTLQDMFMGRLTRLCFPVIFQKAEVRVLFLSIDSVLTDLLILSY